MKFILKIIGLVLFYLFVVFGAAYAAFPFDNEEREQAIWNYEVDFSLPKNIAPKNIAVLIAPHHLVADRQINRAFAFVAASRKNIPPRRVILIGPNHFFRGSGQVITTSVNWQTNYSELAADTDFIRLLTSKNFAKEERDILEGDHSITALLPFIGRFFPDAEFVPLLMREPMKRQDAENLGNFLAQNLTKEDLIIASIDFSHYAPKEVADTRDALSIQALRSLDTDFFEKKIEADGRQILMALSLYLKNRGHTKFHLLDHTNSAVLTGNLADPNATSHILGYY